MENERVRVRREHRAGGRFTVICVRERMLRKEDMRAAMKEMKNHLEA